MVKRAIALAVAASLSLVSFSVTAAEGITPLLPGATTGIPLGALPPEGISISNMAYIVTGRLKDNEGRDQGVKGTDYANTFTATWSSPYKILGGQYGASIALNFARHVVDARSAGGEKTSNFGVLNTILTPLIVSWELSDAIFVSTAQSFYLNTGTFRTTGGVRDQESYATGFATYEPSLAVSYLKDGLNLTANFVYDFNRTNKHTDYKTGRIAYLDWTAAKMDGQLTYGLIGNFTRQTTDDVASGIRVRDNRVEHNMLGVLLGYQINDQYGLVFKYLQDVRARSDLRMRGLYITLNVGF